MEKNEPLRELSNEQLIFCLSKNEFYSGLTMGIICSEILRRMNEIKPLFEPVRCQHDFKIDGLGTCKCGKKTNIAVHGIGYQCKQCFRKGEEE